ncbi:MAG: TetR/AcrR family transcriptional regulator [Solirubrobacteraceae bacterium]|nr:TetR/AcrR family transcriptional regulator [Solirubrobacteraceae bacterium]
MERLEETALDCFTELGFHATSMRTIAARVEVRPASLYHWFPSKQALLQALMTRFLEGLTREVLQVLDEHATPVRRLAAAAWVHVVYHGVHRRAAFVSDTEVRALEGGNAEAIMRLRDSYEQIIRQLISDGVASGDFECRDVRVATKAILLQCTGVAVWYRPNGPFTLPEIAEMHVELVLNSLRVDVPVGGAAELLGDRRPIAVTTEE